MKTSAVLGLSATAVLAIGALSSCSSGSTEDDINTYCSTLKDTRADISSLRSLIASDASVDQVQDQASNVSDSLDQLAEDADAVDKSVADEIEDAYDAYQDVVSEIPSDATVSQAATAYEAASVALVASLDDIIDQVDCS